MGKGIKGQVRKALAGMKHSVPAVSRVWSRLRIWKYERHLLPACEAAASGRTAAGKRAAIERCARKWPGYVADVNGMIDKFIAKVPSLRRREDQQALRDDMLFARLAYGFLPEEYLCFRLEGKSDEEIKAFVSDTDRYRYVAQMNDLFDYTVFMDKAQTYARFRPYFHREAIQISREEHFGAFQTFVCQHPEFVSKQVSQSKGNSVTLMNMEYDGRSERDVFDALIRNGKHILEERITQSPTMAALNASSVNTVRCVTLNTREGIVVPYCFLKVGRNGSFVDNGGAGGLLVGINAETGLCETDGFDEYAERFQSHPETSVAFKGFQLPDWQRMLALCKEMSALEPTIKFIGWDMAHTSGGWVVVEGNGGMQLIGPQVVEERGIKREFEALMQRMDLLV